jgi:hypothetical protein
LLDWDKIAMADDNNVEMSNKKTVRAAFEARRSGTRTIFDLLAADAT